MVKVQDDDASMPVAATPTPTPASTGATTNNTTTNNSNNSISIPNPLTTAVTTTTTITPNTSTPTNNNNSITTTTNSSSNSNSNSNTNSNSNSNSNSTISSNSISSVSNFLPLRHHKPGRHHHHHHHHLQHAPLQHFHHFHHHWSFPDPSAPPPGPATFHFGPGFEPQRYAAGPNPGLGPSVTSNNTAGPSQGAAEHIVHFHVNPGVTVSFQIGDNMELIRGPVTVPMVSTNSSPPIAMPVQVPPGHVVQQIVDENGTLRHVILSPQPPPPQPQPAPLVPMHSHNPHNYGAGNGNTQPAQTFFPQGLPYPPPHFHSNMPPSHMGHVPTSGHLGHSPPPTLGFHKDERTQRQYNKLKRKLEQKRSDGLNSGQTTPLLSPRKELVNGLRRGANAKERGMNSVGTSEDGEESSSVQDDEDEVNVITDVLSSVQSPQVSELSSRSALLQWSVPANLTTAGSNGSPDLDICESDLKYDVLLSDKGKEGKYKSIYIGASLSCRIEDLKPGQEYSVCLQAHLEELQGSASDPITFTTPPCEPDQPLPPKLINRTKTSLQLRWNAATDNGSHILQYILEYDEGKGGGFVELSKCRGKQYNLTKLQPSTTYKFRLAAVNECGKSPYSDVISFSTSGSPPSQPAPPALKEALIDSLRLVWVRRPTDDEFTLQMDEQTGYGFMNSYVGRDTEYTVPKLLRYTNYKFRIRASNEESASSWSEEVTFRTLPDRPGQPSRPTVKGRIHAHSFKLKWEPPHDKGGAEITSYILELCSGRNYETVYTGSETEAVCDKLTPGTTYQLRVSCVSAGGRSNYSDPCTVTTEAICPGKCSNLRLHGKPRATSITLKWTGPDYHGGAPVTEYEVDLVNPELTTSSRQTVYRGKEPECTVTDLLPGNSYSLMARALNRVGFGPWSDVLEATSGAAPPDAPQPPTTTPKSPSHIYVEWHEPNTNGAALTEYKLEMSNTDQEEQFASVFQGLATSHDIKGLTPFTTYFFRVQACNAAGCSPFSLVSATMTPASPPAAMAAPRYYATPVSLTLNWHAPLSNGSDILYYIIELTDKVITTDTAATEYTIDNLKPETVYKIKIKAVNSIGSGAFSPTLRAGTLPLPPVAPKLDCIGVGHNYLKLKWGDGKNADFTQYCVEMENNRTKEFQCIYQGTNFTYKVNKLQELTTYRFRISASSDAGQGDYSDIYEFKTCIAPPAGLKAPKVLEVTQRTCSLEWAPCKILASDPIEYSVQMCRLRDQNFKEMYRGDSIKLSLSDLEPGAEYHVKVCPIRMATTGQLQGVYSPVTSFQTVPLEPALTAKQSSPLVTNSPARKGKNQRLFSWLFVAQHADKKRMSDTQWALVYILCFIVVAVLAAVILEQLFINWRKSV